MASFTFGHLLLALCSTYQTTAKTKQIERKPLLSEKIITKIDVNFNVSIKPCIKFSHISIKFYILLLQSSPLHQLAFLVELFFRLAAATYLVDI